MAIEHLCLGCMSYLENPNAPCPNCGWSRDVGKNAASQLQQGITLTNSTNKNQYLIGKAVGMGGFSIVYVAFNMTNNRKVAIKEYFPTQFVNRDHAGLVIPINDTPDNQVFLAKQKKRFCQEARKMQLFHDSPNVVDVWDYFEANNTAYIVMEFIEGQTFAQVLENVLDKRLTLQTVLANIKPIADILERMHHTPYCDDKGIQHTGITHRDISPENIMYAADGTIKLLDFGEMDFPAIQNPYKALEQQLDIPDPESKQGPWTDVYALAATIYKAITGQIPPDASIRSASDTLIPPSATGIQITPHEEQVLLKGLAVKYPDRYQSVSQFYKDLIKPAPKPIPILEIGPFNKNGDNTYTAYIKYNGDGVLKPSIGFINGNILSVTSANGEFTGAIIASEGAHFAATSTQFNHVERTPPDSSWKKIAWAVAIVAVIGALLVLNKVKAHEIELANIQQQIQSNEEKLEKIRDFTADYGYASSSYYAEKAIVFLKSNSEARFWVYCDVVTKESRAFWHNIDGMDFISVDWETAFNEEHKANIVIKSGDKSGCSTIRFTNEANNDSFDVLVVVQ